MSWKKINEANGVRRKHVVTLIKLISFKPPKESFGCNEKKVSNIDKTWSMDVSELVDYHAKRKKRCRYILIVIKKSCSFKWTIPLGIEYAKINRMLQVEFYFI